MLEKMAKAETVSRIPRPSGHEFGQVMKEGPARRFRVIKDSIAKLCCVSLLTHNENADQTVSLEAYVSRMKEGQDEIYFIVADSL